LWQSQGRSADARRRLAKVCDEFTEGFEIADFRKARTLLETLASG
jgi:hypothetical protein